MGTGPAAYRLLRNGKAMNVCTRCYLTVDKERVSLVQIADNLAPFMQFDPLGCVALIGHIDTSTERISPDD